MGESRKIVVRVRLSWPSRFSTGRGPISGNCGTYFITAPLDIQASAITSVRSDRIRLAQVRPPAPQRDRKSVVSGKSVSVRVDLGGRRIIKTKNIRETKPKSATMEVVYSNKIHLTSEKKIPK